MCRLNRFLTYAWSLALALKESYLQTRLELWTGASHLEFKYGKERVYPLSKNKQATVWRIR